MFWYLSLVNMFKCVLVSSSICIFGMPRKVAFCVYMCLLIFKVCARRIWRIHIFESLSFHFHIFESFPVDHLLIICWSLGPAAESHHPGWGVLSHPPAATSPAAQDWICTWPDSPCRYKQVVVSPPWHIEIRIRKNKGVLSKINIRKEWNPLKWDRQSKNDLNDISSDAVWLYWWQSQVSNDPILPSSHCDPAAKVGSWNLAEMSWDVMRCHKARVHGFKRWFRVNCGQAFDGQLKGCYGLLIRAAYLNK